MLKSKNYGDRLEVRKIFRDNSGEWGKLRRSTAAWGLRDVIIAFVITILIYKETGSELSVGKLVLVASLVSSASFALEQKLIKPRRRMLSIVMGAIVMFIAVIGLVIKINYFTLLLFIVLDAAFVPFFITPLTSASFNVINGNHEENLRVEYVINKEIVLNSGRIASTLILIFLLTIIKAGRSINYFLLFVGCTQFISLYFARNMKIWKTDSIKYEKS